MLLILLTFILFCLILIDLYQINIYERFGPEIAGTTMWKGVHTGPTIMRGAVYGYPVENPL